MKKLLFATILLVMMAMVISACSGSGGGGGSKTSTIDVTMADIKFDPSTWTVNAGSQVTVNIKNTGTVEHTWTVMKTPISGSYTAANQSDIYYNSDKIPAGTTKTVTFTAPSQPGNYQVICTVPGHFEAGMVGQLTVK